MYSIANHFKDKYIEKKNINMPIINSVASTHFIDINNLNFSSIERFLSHYLSKDEIILRDNLVAILNENYWQQMNQNHQCIKYIGDNKWIFNITSINFDISKYFQSKSFNLYSYFLKILDIIKIASINKSSWRKLLLKYLKKQDIKTIIGISALRNFILQNKLILSFTTVFDEKNFVTTFDQYICCLCNTKLQASSTRYPRIYYYHSEVYNDHVINVKTNEY